ncbi:MAG: hypothetical protein ACKV2U_31995 [Bryobacteraceae bacterium]
MNKALSSLFLLFFLAAAPPVGASPSYVVLQDLDEDSLIRVSADGKSVTTIASGAAGVGLARDRKGDYVVAARSALLRVTRSGVVTTIAKAPPGSEWVAVVADAEGNLIVADDTQHAVWRVAEDGNSILMIARHPGYLRKQLWGAIGLAVEKSGDYLLLREGDKRTLEFYRVTPAGAVSKIPLSGATLRFGGAMLPDEAGNYLFASCSPAIFRITPKGVISELIRLDDTYRYLSALARNPETGEFVGARLQWIVRVGEGLSATDLTSSPKVRIPMAILAETGN